MSETSSTNDVDVRFSIPLPIAIPLAIVITIGVAILVIARILLEVPEGVAAAVAAMTAINVVAGCAFIATRERVGTRQILELGLIALYPIIIGAVIAYVGFGSTEAAASKSASAAPQNTLTDVTVTAANVKFDTSTITVAANKKVTVHFDNKDSPSVQHNIAFYESESATKKIYEGKTIPGGSTADYSFKTPKPGTYFFRCDVHPTSMMGKFVVK